LTVDDFDRELLRTPFARGGRQVGRGLDCLGVVCAQLGRRGVDFPDPWQQLAASWQAGEPLDVGPLMPAGWRRLGELERPRDLDVVFLDAARASIGLVEDGRVWTATDEGGVLRLPLERCKVAQAWRRCP
jgi:hypothetical protein